MDKQASLFENQPQERGKGMHTLHITKDNQAVDMSIEELFDSTQYDTLTGVTFSISPTFMNQYCADFKKLELVVGIPEERVKYGANVAAKHIKAKIEGDLKGEPAELYQGLSTDIKRQLNDHSVELFVPLACVIHSKFYLLSHSETGNTRLIMGSANLSEQAFKPNSNQFETVIVFDNHPLFDVYTSYYEDDLKPVLTNYLPTELLKINAKKLKTLTPSTEKDVDEVILLSNQDVNRIKEKAVTETLEQTQEKMTLGILPAQISEEMRNITDDRPQEVKAQREDKKNEDVAYTIVKEAISPRAKDAKIKSAASLTKMVKKKVMVKVSETEDTGLPERPMMVNSPEQRNVSKNITGLFTPSVSNKERLLPIGQKADKGQIKQSLEVINRLMKTFEKYTVKYDDSYGARVMEAMFYTFTAPQLFEIKRKARSEEERNDIPQFLFLGGTAGSGKSSLLKMLAKMTNQPSTWDYNSIVPSGGRRKKATIDALEMWLGEQNVAPLLIDEIPEEFFTNRNYGNELIVNTSNRMAYNLQACPALIGTTNADGYTLEERARRRSYYLKLDKIFDEMFRGESQPAYNAVYESIDDTLFSDFMVRLAERLSDDTIDWAHFENNGKIDFLYHTREIFKDYYEMADMPLPRYFPGTRYDDSRETNQEKWRKLFLGTSQNEFKFDEISGNLLFKVSTLDENVSRFGGGKPSEIYKNALSAKVIVGSKDGTDIELDTPLFFEWINVENPFAAHYVNQLKQAYLEHPNKFLQNKKEETITFNLSEVVAAQHPDTLERYMEYLPHTLVLSQETHDLTVDAPRFCQWLDVPYKPSFWKKLVS